MWRSTAWKPFRRINGMTVENIQAFLAGFKPLNFLTTAIGRSLNTVLAD